MKPNSIPLTGWFTADHPAEDYALLITLAATSSWGNPDKIEKLDLVHLKEDFESGKYFFRDYYLGFVDADRPTRRADNAIHDLNTYLEALRAFQKREMDLSRLAAVRFHQTDGWIDKVVFEYKQPPAVV